MIRVISKATQGKKRPISTDYDRWIPKIWHNKTLWPLLVCRAADTKVEQDGGEHGAVHGELPIHADDGEICVGGSLEILP